MNNNTNPSQLNPRATQLLVELRKEEPTQNLQILAGDLDRVNLKLLSLYRVTDNYRSQFLIMDLLSEIADSGVTSSEDRDQAASDSALAATESLTMSQEKFLDLIPANINFH